MARTNFISLGLVASAVGVVFGLYYTPDSLVSPALAFAVIIYAALAIACSINVAFMGMVSQLVNSRSKFMSLFIFLTIGIFAIPAFASIFY